MRRVILTLLALIVLAIVGSSTVLAVKTETFICHATNDPGHFNFIIVDDNALAGHQVGDEFHVNKKTGEQDYFANPIEIAAETCGATVAPTPVPSPTPEESLSGATPTPVPSPTFEQEVGPSPTIWVNNGTPPAIPDTAIGADDNDEDRNVAITFGGVIFLIALWMLVDALVARRDGK